SRVAFAREGRCRLDQQADRLIELARSARELGVELPRLSRLRHRPVYLFGQGAEGRGTGAQQGGFCYGPEGRVLDPWLAQGNVLASAGEDVRQDGVARVRADRAYRDVRRGAADL